MIKPILPPATIGIIGGGQLGQMMALAAKPMGYRVIVLDPNEQAPAAQVADDHIIADYDNQMAMNQLATLADVVTYEFENVDRQALMQIESLTEVPQSTRLLELTSDRIKEKQFIQDLGLPVAPFEQIDNVMALNRGCETIGLPAILKTITGGYDGHGQWDISNQADLDHLILNWLATLEQPLILEKKLSFERELSIMVTRDGQNNIHTWPIAENVHENHVLKWSSAPANVSDSLETKIKNIAHTLAEALNLRGMLGIELFVQGDEVYVNELAPRPHNSGHYTIEGTNVSQFEGHIRSVTGLSIAPIEVIEPALMLNLLGDEMTRARHDLPVQVDWHFHDYGKQDIKAGRKMGHITVLGTPAIAALRDWGNQNDNA